MTPKNTNPHIGSDFSDFEEEYLITDNKKCIYCSIIINHIKPKVLKNYTVACGDCHNNNLKKLSKACRDDKINK